MEIENYTQGCLALNNEKLKELEKILIIKTVLITSGDEFKKAKKKI